MKRALTILVLLASAFAFPQEEEAHLHGPDGRHIVAPQAGGGGQKFILSHHDMRIEGPDGKSALGCVVDSTISRKGDPDAVVHRERNVYEPENEVYGSHMTYKEPGEYVLSQKIRFPDGKSAQLEFPVFVPALAGDAEHEHGPNYVIIVGGVLAGLAALAVAYAFGRKSSRAAAVLLALALAMPATQRTAFAQDEEGHLHGPDGRHLVAGGAGGAGGPMLKAYPAPNRGESAEKVVDGIRYVLSIENEEMTPDPDLVSVGADQSKLIGIKTGTVEMALGGKGLRATGRVAANPDGMVLVNARTSGRVASLGALPGTLVRQGQSLAVIESPDLADAQAAHRRAAAEIVQADAGIGVAQSALEAAELRQRIALQGLERKKQMILAGAYRSPTLEAARSATSKAEADVVVAARTVQALTALVGRLEAGVASGVVARRELEEARTSLDSAKSRLTDLERQLDLTKAALAREETIAGKGLFDARELEAAQADADLARSSVAASRSGLAQARADKAQAQTALQAAAGRIQLLGGSPGGGNRVAVLAPISGEVERRPVSVGQTVQSGQELFELLNAKVVWVLCDVYERDIPTVMAGQAVDVVADALPDRIYAGTVAFVHNEVDAGSRTAKVRVVVDNPGELLKQNMFVRAQLRAAGGDSSTTVPTSAVQTVGGVSVVFLEETVGTYRRVVVQPLGTFGSRTSVRADLKRGAKVVTDGAYQLAAMVEGR